MESSTTAETESKEPSSDSIVEVEEYSIFTSVTRLYLTYLLGFIIILSTLTATIYFPLIPMLSIHFSVSIQAINLTVTVYAVCQAISPIFFASLADTFGRRPVLIGLICAYACASLGLALNKSSYAALLVLRGLQSIGGSATVSIAYGIVADVAFVSERGKMLGPMLSTCNAISAVGPVIGGAVAMGTSGYSWVFLILLAIAVISVLLVGLTLPETARNVVGNGKQPTRGIHRTWYSMLRGSKTLCAENQAKKTERISQPVLKRKKWRVSDAFTSLRIILHPDALLVLIMISTSYSVYYTFQAAIPVIYKEIYHYNELQIGLTFLPGLAGMTLGGIIAGKLVDRNYVKTAFKHNFPIAKGGNNHIEKFPIEAARYRNIIPFILLEVVLLVGYGWIIHYHVHPAVPLILQFFACGVSTLLSHTASALLVDIFPKKSSTAYASSQLARCGLSAGSVAILQPIVEGIGRGWYFTCFAFLVGVCGVGSVAMSRWKGMKWRVERMRKECGE